LVVAGGGGGTFTGSGGGAGGVLYNASFPVSAGTSYTATVGAGGRAGGVLDNNPSVGGNSIFGSLTAIGGGYGVTHGATTGSNGGSGGGAAQVFTAGTSCSPGLGVDGQGFMGGQTPIGVNDWPGGSAGGGGAGGPGQRGGANIQGFGAGGIGRFFPQFASIGGSPAGWFGGGGGGGEVNHSFITEGGLGGGGKGIPDAAGESGVANTGGGGAGGGYSGPYFGGGFGGSGIVIVRYQLPVRAIGGTITIEGNNVTHTFTSGTNSFVVTTSARTFNSGPTYSNLSSGMLSFNGTSQYLTMPTDGLPYGNSASTMEAWVMNNTATAASGYQFAVSYGTAATNQARHLGVLNNTFIHGSYGASDITSGTVAQNVWYHLAGTFDGVNHRLYVNGVLLTTSGSTTFNTTSATAQIGRQVNAIEYWNGNIANVKIYNRALSATEILQNYLTSQSKFTSIGGQLAKFDGSSLTGWTNNGVTVNAVTGNAAPSLYANISQNAYIAPATITSFANTTITFDVNITSNASICNLFFAANASGMGTMLRLEGRTGFPSGFMAPAGWNSWDAGPSGGPTLAASTWYNVKIQITPAGAATWYLNGTLQSSTASVRLLGNYIGIHGDGAGTGAYFDNIIVYSGIV
jgi:hypothetical protein